MLGALFILALSLKHFGQLLWMWPIMTALGWILTWLASKSEGGRGLLRVVGLGRARFGLEPRLEPKTQIITWAALTLVATGICSYLTWF